MAKLAFLVPRGEMIDYVKQIAAKLGIGDVQTKLVSLDNVVQEATDCMQNGADVLVARGYQASLIKQAINAPVVEIVMTGQEMAMLVYQAKQMLHKENPTIGVVGNVNMFPDMSLFDDIFHVQLKTYFVNATKDIDDAVDRMHQDRVDLMIGGDIAIARAQKLGMQYLFLNSHSGDSIREAFYVAQRVGYASDLEKEKSAELKTLLDYSFNGIIKLDSSGTVSVINHVAEAMLQVEETQVVGRHISKIMESVDPDMLRKVMEEGHEIYASFLKVRSRELVISLAPIRVKDRIDGAIISFNEIKKLTEIETRVRKEIYQRGFVARYKFEDLQKFALDDSVRFALDLAKKYAGTDLPVLIFGETGTEKEAVAQCIHNESMRSNGAYLHIRCGELAESEQYDVLFGTSGETEAAGAVTLAHEGTLVLQDVEKLNTRSQQCLLGVLKNGVLQRSGKDNPLPVSVRLICTTAQNLSLAVQKGSFDAELFYCLSAFALTLPPLSQRRESINALVEHYFAKYEEKYSRLLVLTKGAKKVLKEYDWQGNLVQLENFCRRVVVSAVHRTVDETMVRRLLEEVYPIVRKRKSDEKIVVYKSPEAAKLATLLDECGGNRTEAARRLNISKTTLWRKMKRYNISGKYEI
jgi:transcriptional regulator with PAS, ATPase and Fis domain